MTPLQAALAESEQVAAGIERSWQALAGLESTSESTDGYVRVTVDAGGRISRLELDPRIYRNADAEALTGTILRTVAEAARLVRRRAFEAIAPLLPAGAEPESADLLFGPLLAELNRRTTTTPRGD